MAKKKSKVGRPRTVRVRKVYESAVYSTSELVARYGKSRRTIRRSTEEEGFPKGWMDGREMKYAKHAVHAWEKIHRPDLYSEPEKTEEDKHWDRLRARYLLDKEEAAAHGENPPPSPPRSPSRGIRV